MHVATKNSSNKLFETEPQEDTVANVGPIPDKIGIYLCTWDSGAEYYNVFDGKGWCWGAPSRLHGKRRPVEPLIAEIGKRILSDSKGEDFQYLTRFTYQPADRSIVAYELVAELGVPSER